MLARARQDTRGLFVKTVHAGFFAVHGLATGFREQYYSVSTKGCLRGMHFQTPPHDHEKLVYCVDGAVMDVIVDLRRGSSTFGTACRFLLSAESRNQIYIARGLAHGFQVLSPTATLVYNVTSEYAPAQDAGIHWRSVPIEWPDPNPLVSERDSNHPSLADFESPFVM